MNLLGDSSGERNAVMSAMRIHRLQALAVQKLAAAYRADETALSVVVMQDGSVFEDIEEHVPKVGASSFVSCLTLCISFTLHRSERHRHQLFPQEDTLLVHLCSSL